MDGIYIHYSQECSSMNRNCADTIRKAVINHDLVVIILERQFFAAES